MAGPLDDTQGAAGYGDETTVLPDLTPTAEHRSGLAWSDIEVLEDDIGGRRTWRATLVRATLVLAIAAAIAVGAAFFAVNHRERHATPPAASLPKPVPTAPALDGVYRIDIDNAHATFAGNIDIPPDPHAAPDQLYWGFRSACTASGCTATATSMSNATQTDVLHFVDGRWVDAAPDREQEQCTRDDGTTAVHSSVTTWSFLPEADGRYHGTVTHTFTSNECGRQGNSATMPLTLTRTGPLPPGAAVADPSTVR